MLTTAVSLPQVSFPEDPCLEELPKLFDPEWVWRSYCQRFGVPESDPYRIRIRQFSHNPRRTAAISYEIGWGPEEYIAPQIFVVKMERDKPTELFRYPEDPHLPGLKEAADPEGAFRLMNRHVLAIPARRAVFAGLVRYRPGSRAVLHHRVGRVGFYARVMRPAAVAPLLTARELMGLAGFVVPRLAGCWADGGVVWMSEIPGENLRRRIRQGYMPDPEVLLSGLETLWNSPDKTQGSRPFNLPGAYNRAKRNFRQNLPGEGPALRLLNDTTGTLDEFIRSWKPTCMAHNDLYDDQMFVLNDGRIALVDFEEAGPGDPMLDVGNFLAHLRWASCFGSKRENDASGAYYPVFRQAALDRFRWSERDFAFREAVCLFRICTNTIRRPQEDWLDVLERGLFLVSETLRPNFP